MIGASVPDRLSVVGFDDIFIAAHTVPALTTVRMPIAEMVREAVGTAIELARNSGVPRPEPTKVVFEPRLVVRHSTAAPRA
jgi:DNA-binding LacI/PurR family transcriptional regulator